MLELLWWFVTAVILAGVLFPIFSGDLSYRFWLLNSLFIVAFVTFTRFIFLTKYTFLASRQVLKVALVFVSVPIVFLLINAMIGFQTILDEDGPDALFFKNNSIHREYLVNYIRSEMVFFGMGSIISGIFFPIKMIISVWRYRNRGEA